MTRESLLDHLERDEIEAVLQGLAKQFLARGDEEVQRPVGALPPNQGPLTRKGQGFLFFIYGI